MTELGYNCHKWQVQDLTLYSIEMMLQKQEVYTYKQIVVGKSSLIVLQVKF